MTAQDSARRADLPPRLDSIRSVQEGALTERSSSLVVREELRRLGTWGERHRRLLARLVIALALTVVVDASGAVLVWLVERHAKGTDVHTYGDALFFSTVQVLTVSSSLKNPLTTTGRVVDVLLEVWAVFVITAVAGSFAAFFHTGDAAG